MIHLLMSIFILLASPAQAQVMCYGTPIIIAGIKCPRRTDGGLKWNTSTKWLTPVPPNQRVWPPTVPQAAYVGLPPPTGSSPLLHGIRP
jgi:hypothetical protein